MKGVRRLAKYAALTMVHRETDYLRLWIRYYGELLGKENLYIVAHGGDAEIAEISAGCRLVFLPRLSVDGSFDARRFEVLNAYANYLLTQYDGLIAGDVDELLFVDPAQDQSLVDFAESHRGVSNALRAFGMNIFERTGDAPLDLNQPILKQRRYARCEQDYCKPLIVFSRPEWSVGYHAVKGDPYMPDGLYLAHLHYFSMEVVSKVARHRAQTLAENDKICDSRGFRSAWWGKREKHARAYIKQMSSRPVENLDNRIDELRGQLRGNSVQSRWGGRGYTQMAFDGRQEFIVQLPERFGGVF